MARSSILDSISHLLRPRRGAAATGRRGPSRSPVLEPLEGRALLATIPVTSPADAGPGTLRAAIEHADLDQNQDTITFAPSVTGTITLSTVLPNLTTNMIIAGPGASALSVARSGADGTPDFRIFTVTTGVEASISGLTITGGRESTGGGISNAGTLTLTECTLSGNSADGSGVVFSGHGGGIYNSGTLTLTDCTLSSNSASGLHGGSGGGIYNSGALTVTDCTLGSNSAAGEFFNGSGGGIYNSGTLTVTDCTLSSNSAGGGTYVGGYGGGIDNDHGRATLTDCTLSGNSVGASRGGGGGIANSGTITLTDCTLSANSAISGGGVYSSHVPGEPVDKVTTIMSLFADPVGGNLVVEAAAFVSLGHNLFSDTPSVALDPTDLINTDPLLGPLADNGGPTLTQALLPGSPAIDAGIAVPGVTTDQRGIPRPQGIAPDIGAFESRGFTLAIVGGDDQRAPVGSPFPVPLAVVVASPFGEPVAGGRVSFTSPAMGASADLAGSPVTLDPSGQASVNASANGMGGNYTVIARVAGAGDVAFTLTNLNRTIALTSPAGVNVIGQVATVTATVDDDEGRPLAGIPVSFSIIAGPNAGATGTTDPVDGRTDANGQVRFSYLGAGGPGTDTIVATARLASGVTIAAPAASVVWTVAPTVVSLHRLGFHLHPTTLVVTFSQPMDAARAASRAEYRLIGPGPDHKFGTKDDHRIRIRSARYNPATDSVVLRPVRRLPLHDKFQLTVKGTAPDGLASTLGIFLDGAKTGQPGSNYVARITRKSLVLPKRHPRAQEVRGSHALAARPTGAHRAT
jgi:hypothetical protein